MVEEKARKTEIEDEGRKVDGLRRRSSSSTPPLEPPRLRGEYSLELYWNYIKAQE